MYNVGIEISFAQWVKFGLPISILLLAICWFYLTRFAFKFEMDEFPGGAEEIKRLIKGLGKWSYEEKVVLVIFACAALLWVLRS